ncbi:hypothetical protein JCM8547_007220 [Rhodosporidiobolus lusitaniae]
MDSHPPSLGLPLSSSSAQRAPAPFALEGPFLPSSSSSFSSSTATDDFTSALLSAHHSSRPEGDLSWSFGVVEGGGAGAGRSGGGKQVAPGARGGGVGAPSVSSSTTGAANLLNYLHYSLRPPAPTTPNTVLAFLQPSFSSSVLLPSGPRTVPPAPIPSTTFPYYSSFPSPGGAYGLGLTLPADESGGSSSSGGSTTTVLGDPFPNAYLSTDGIAPMDIHGGSSCSSLEGFSPVEGGGAVQATSGPSFGWNIASNMQYLPTPVNSRSTTAFPSSTSHRRSLSPVATTTRTMYGYDGPPLTARNLARNPSSSPAAEAVEMPSTSETDLPSPGQAFTSLRFSHSVQGSEYTSADGGGLAQLPAPFFATPHLALEGNNSNYIAVPPPPPVLPQPAQGRGRALYRPPLQHQSVPSASSSAKKQVEVEKVSKETTTAGDEEGRESKRVRLDVPLSTTGGEPDSEADAEGSDDEGFLDAVVLPLEPPKPASPKPTLKPAAPPARLGRKPALSAGSSRLTASSTSSSPSRPSLVKNKQAVDVGAGEEEWASETELFAPFEPKDVLLDEEGNEITFSATTSNPSSFVYDTAIPAWRTYRRNFLSLPLSLSLPSSVRLSDLHTSSSASSIVQLEASLTSATYPKGQNVELLQFDASRSLKQAQTLGRQTLSPASKPVAPPPSTSTRRKSSSSTPSPSTAAETPTQTLSTTFSRIQYRHATANHPMMSSGADDARFVLLCKVYAVHADGTESELGGWRSAKVVVRGRSPGNFAKKGKGKKGGKEGKGGRKRKAEEEDDDEEAEDVENDEEDDQDSGKKSKKRPRLAPSASSSGSSPSSPSSSTIATGGKQLDPTGRTRAASAALR